MADPTSKYASQLRMLTPLFPDWDEDALASVLADARGNVEEAALLITDGRATKFTTASRKKEKKPVSSKPGAHTNGNADSGGFPNYDSNGFSGRGGFRGGRGGSRGGRGGSDSFRGAVRGGRGGLRGGRGGFRGGRPINGAGDANAAESSTSAWGSTAGEPASSEAPVATPEEPSTQITNEPEAPKTATNEEFAAAGGWGDAPVPAETEAAVKSGAAWGEKPSVTGDIPPVPKKVNTVPQGAKLSWAQIAKPPAPKPAPPPKAPAPPAPVETKPVEPEVQAPAEPTPAEESVPEPVEEVTQEDIDLAPQQLDQPEVVEQEEEVEEPVQQQQDPEPVQTQVDPMEPEPTAAEPMKDPWSSAQAAPSAWEQPAQQSKEQAAPAVPESSKPAAESYTGPPGFNAAVRATTTPYRTNSRAALRYKADGQAVMLPGSAAGSSSLDMKFGSLNFGNPDADETEQSEPAQETAPQQVEPTPQEQTPVAPSISQPAAISQQQQSLSQPTPPTQSAQIVPQVTQSASQAAPAAQQSVYGTTLGYYPTQQQQQQQQQQQYGQYGQSQAQQPLPQQYYQQGIQQSQPQQQSTASPVVKESQPASASVDQQGLNQQTQNYYQQAQPDYQSRYQDASGQGFQQNNQSLLQQQQQQLQQQHQQSAYGNFPQQAYGYAQPQAQQSQPQQSTDIYSSTEQQRQQSIYDSYAASGYPRQGTQEPAKQATPQPLSAQASGIASPAAQPQQQAPPSGYYGGAGMSGYYAPYNPYFQYGQAPTPGYQSYYPMAQAARGPYQPSPAAPSVPLMSQGATSKPGSAATSQGQYGLPQGGQASTEYDNGYMGSRYSDSKAYQSQLQNYLGNPTPATSIPGVSSTRPGQTAAEEDPYKTGMSGIGRASSAASGNQQTLPGQQQQQLGGAQQQFPSYGYSTGYPQQNDWAQYAQYRGGQQGGYWS